MSLNGLRTALEDDPVFARVRQYALKPHADRSQDLQFGAPSGLRAALLAEVAEGLAEAPAVDGRRGVVLAVTATERETEDLTAALRAYLPAGSVAEFPSWETLPHERLSPRSDTVGRRLAVLRRLAHPEEGEPSAVGGAAARAATSGSGGSGKRAGATAPDAMSDDVGAPLRVVVAPVRAVLQPLVAGLGELVPVTISVGDEVPFTELVHRLADAAYSRVDMVTRRGEFAVRGGILDVFPPTEDHPIRVEFFGDEVDQMRWFSVADQRSLTASADSGSGHPTTLYAPPCREILITPEVMSRAAKLKDRMPAAAGMLEKIAGGIAVEGMESLAPALVDAMVPLAAQFPPGSVSVVIEPEKVRARAHDLESTNEEFLEAAWSTASEGGVAPLDLAGQEGIDLAAASFKSLGETRSDALAAGLSWWSITSLTRTKSWCSMSTC